MRSTQLRWVLPVSIMAVTAFTASAQAEVWGNVVRGMSLFDYRFNGEKNFLGDGWDINATAIYSGQEYDFGIAELTLGSPNAPTASNFSVGFTRRFLPAAEFSWNTGGRALPYSFRINSGFQDFTTIDGSILIDVSTDVNILGFYDTRVQISNRGTFGTDGFLADEEGNLAFDVGPIDISGNIYADALAVVTQPLWLATGTENPFTKFSNKATKTASLNATVEELQARIQAGEVLSDDELATLVNSTLISAILTGEAGNGNLLQGLTLPIIKEQTAPSAQKMMIVPEPASALLLLGFGGLLTLRRPRR